MTPSFKWMKDPVYEPPYVRPETRRAYLKHRSMVLPVLLVLAAAAMIFGCLVALSGWQAPQL